MHSNILGLIELLLVLSAAIGWGVYELLSLKRPRERAPPPPAKDDERST